MDRDRSASAFASASALLCIPGIYDVVAHQCVEEVTYPPRICTKAARTAPAAARSIARKCAIRDRDSPCVQRNCSTPCSTTTAAEPGAIPISPPATGGGHDLISAE